MNAQDITLTEMHTLKLRQTSLSDASLQSIIAKCPNLRRLDLSFTLVQHPVSLFSTPNIPLTKLSLTSTRVSSADLLAIISILPHLQTLALGALGERQGSSATMGNTSALTITNKTLMQLTDILQDFRQLENISLVGNSKLCLTERTDGAMSDFVRRVGRRCKVSLNGNMLLHFLWYFLKSLSLGAIQPLRSACLVGLLPDTVEKGPPQLRTLVLKLTGVDDEAAPFISSCTYLETLDVSSTKFTSRSSFTDSTEESWFLCHYRCWALSHNRCMHETG